MKYTGYLFAFLIMVAGAGCQELKCPAFDDTERNNWLPQEMGGTIVFEQEADHSTLTFTVDEVSLSQAYKERARSMSRPQNCKTSGSVKLTTTNTQVVQAPGYTLGVSGTFLGEREEMRDLLFHLGDFEGLFYTYPTVKMSRSEASPSWERDSIISTLVLGGKTYTNAVVQSRNLLDTSKAYQIQKVYLAPGYGIVGFVSKGKRYYRK